MSSRLLRFLNWSDWAGKVLKEGCGLFVCLLLSINTIQGDGGSHSQADQKCQPSDWKGRYPSDQAVHTQRWRGSHQREQTPAITRSEFFWLPRPQKKKHVLLCLVWIQLKMDNTYGNLVIIHFLSRVWSVLPGNLRNVLFIYFPNCFINWHRHFWSSEQKTITLWKAQLWLFFLLFLYIQVVFTCFCLPKCPVSPKMNPKQVLSVSTRCWFCHFL